MDIPRGHQVELFDQDIQDIRSHIGRQGRSETNVRHAHIQQGQENGRRLLFQMRQGQTQGQVIDSTIQGLGQFGRDDDGGIGIIALSHIQDPGHTICQSLAQQLFRMNESIFGASQSQNQCIVRQFFSQVRKVTVNETNIQTKSAINYASIGANPTTTPHH